MIMNTAQGVQRVPQDYLNVARVLNLSEWKIVTKILFPSVLPYMLTGIRLSIGTEHIDDILYDLDQAFKALD